MNAKDVAQSCLDGAETGAMNFPQIVGALSAAGFEGYHVDYRQGAALYYGADGQSVALKMHEDATLIAPAFDANAVRDAILEAQTNAPGYSYRGFCERVRRAGCAGYIVSFPGRRVVYYGRTSEMHVEHFPPSR